MRNMRVKGETATPTALLGVMAAVGPTKAAKALGVSQTTLYKAQRENVVSRVYEVAAEGWLDKHNGHANGTLEKPVDKSLMLLDVPADKVELIKRFAAQVGAEEVH